MKLFTAIIIIISVNTCVYAANLTTATSTLFSGSGNCVECHSSDGAANTEQGIDVSPMTQWRSTMMGNAARDPLWRAKVSAEIASFPALQGAIETKCSRCHAPMGNYQAEYDGQVGYSLAEMEASPLALDGVSCTVCHQTQPDNLGEQSSYSGHFEIDGSRSIFGPYNNPLTGPMQNMTNYTPVGATHTADSELCATCHTLFTAHVNEVGELEGSFPEQTPYLEWKNSRFMDDGIECQSCHMPVSSAAIDISSRPPWHQVARSPYSYHTMTGANIFMLEILKNNITELGLTATAAQFDSSIVRTRNVLQTQTVSLSETHHIDGDTLAVDLRLENLTGHKLPTGIPLRRMWIHLLVTDSSGATVFESGQWNDQGEVFGLDAAYEPHHDLITSTDQVQVYETIMGDADNQPTWTLLSAAGYLKDNRIPPVGFTTTAAVYDSVRIEGAAGMDADFNHDSGLEGSGADVVHYRFPMGVGDLSVQAQVCYQTLPPRVYDDLRSYDTPEVNLFAGMYEAADKSPVIFASLNFNIDTAAGIETEEVPQTVRLNRNVPNPFNPSTLISYEITLSQMVQVEVYDVKGHHIRTLFSGFRPSGYYSVVWDGTDDSGNSMPSGTYLYSIQSESGQTSRSMMLVR